MEKKEITVLMVEPGKHPRVTTLGTKLDDLQKAVSIGADYQGLIEFVSLGNGDCIMCNEEGKLIGLEGNRRLGKPCLLKGMSRASLAMSSVVMNRAANFSTNLSLLGDGGKVVRRSVI